ncbi:Eco57I restriction-modification methylase domain-containing protein [Halopelagius fulvigenes]|uniref:site-specific DNA-methyltransferase (adenine-specific) n=1 Tax=Halopelagius fulvigenes TaxID=1198324 RepID=A0ABD5TY92_9EURY
MADASALHNSLQAIAGQVNGDMSERDVENLFLEHEFYDALDYEGTGTDIRSEFTLPDDRRPDYITLDSSEAVTAVYEFKTTGRDLPPHESQLFHYMDYLRAEFGVLTNGEQLRLYRRGESSPILIIPLDSATESDARDLVSSLRKRNFDLTNPDHVNRFLSNLDPIPLDEQAELGQAHFFDTFRLEEDSPFADLVTGMMDLLYELRDEEEEKFVKGAYDFWEATYASEPDEVPDSWDPFIDGKQSLRDFMFCLESAHAMLARLLLTKATEDHEFFEGTGYNGMEDYFHGLQGFSDSINLDAFPVAADNLIDDMQEQLVEGLFQDDIFVWWTDGYVEQLSRQHATGANQFAAVAEGTGSVERISAATRDRFSRAVAEVFFNILRFDFSNVEGDLLGDLYQRYFDPETRKALGEFYTPQPVIDYIMDGVGYERGVSNKRLIDPACGSGTFLVEAVERYIEDIYRYEENPDWEERLRDLCTRPRIVGLDIHPFAVLMAQIRFVVAVLPAYREAKRSNPNFTLRRLPIYRTDSLRNERKLSGVNLGTGDAESWQSPLDAWDEDEKEVMVPVPLPVEVDEEDGIETEAGFLVRRVRMPLYTTIRAETDVQNFGEYFAALQGVLDTVKDHMAEFDDTADWDWTYSGGLESRINRYTSQEYDGLEDFFEEYVNDMLENVRYLKEEHNDGRLFKMFEDTVLALVVKNYMEYDYVVGNPPYVRIQNLPDKQKEMMSRLYDATTGNYDIYCPFYERGLDWLRADTGKLGFITPNQFMVTDYGEGLRKVLLEDSRIQELYDFRDSGVFEDATNYPAIVILEDESDEAARQENQIRCVRVKANTDEENDREVDEAVIESVREHRGESGYSDEFIDVFDFPQRKLSEEGYWPFMPPEELQVFEKLESRSTDNFGEITDAIFAGTQTSANKVYLVKPVNADRIEPDDGGDTVRVVPTGENQEYEIETDLLCPWLKGKDVERWRGEWSGLHVILPHYVEGEGDEATTKAYDAEYLQQELPLTWQYFEAHRGKLESRESGRMDSREDWYAFIYPKSHERFEKPKIIGAHISKNSRFMIDSDGMWYFKTAYGIELDKPYRDLTEEMACQLNSKAIDFYFKHITTVKMGGYYEYRSQYVEKLPCVTDDTAGVFGLMREKAEKIVETIDLDSKTNRFPEAYLGEYDGELDYINYEWQTRRYPVNADVQGDVEGDFTVQAGRSDTISHPAMYSDDREARKMRAEYVHAAVNGRNVKSGEETTIPIPQSDNGVEELLTRLEDDRVEVEQTDIDELEAEIDDAVYQLFDLTDNERQVVEDYLEVF